MASLVSFASFKKLKFEIDLEFVFFNIAFFVLRLKLEEFVIK